MGRADLARLVEANAPLWGGEAEVFRTYWDWPGRTVATDRSWVRRQACKEFWDGYAPHAGRIAERWPSTGPGWPIHDALEALEVAKEELRHYAAFADLYDLLRDPREPGLDPESLKGEADWPENQALRRLRARHREEHGDIGVRATWFTEGGYATLFREAAALAGRGGIDAEIAARCGPIYEDEVDHMLSGIAGLADADLAPAAWDLLIALTTDQCRQRIRMRAAQFGHPVAADRLEALVAGRGTPEPFDWKRAGA